MASITIRNLDERVKSSLRLRAASHGRSMEEEVRDILKTVLANGDTGLRDLASAVRARLKPLGGVNLPQSEREPVREPPAFEE